MSDFVPVPPFRGGGRGGGVRGRHRGGRWNSGGGRGRGFRGGRGRGGRGRGRGFHSGGRRGGGGFRRENEIFEETGTPTETSVSIAVEGCCHGALDEIYARIKDYEEKEGRKVDILICCGDFQSLRTHADFHNFAAPPKYRQLGSFVKYYAEKQAAPLLTLFVGGNHENSQQLQELYYGGWVAPNMYYMGAAGVVNFKGIRIGGISGIYKSHDYQKGHFERPPYNRSTLRSVYHVRNLEVFRMKSLAKQRRLDVMVSHDWPQGIEAHGNTNDLVRRKPYFLEEVKTNTLGSPANREILETIKPKNWFSAHLHVGFKATLNHGSDTTTAKPSSSTAVTDLVPSQTVKAGPSPPIADRNNDEGTDSPNDTAVSETTPEDQKPMQFCQPVAKSDGEPKEAGESTTFVSLDKCLPGRAFLSLVHIEPSAASQDAGLEYDPEWLAILRKTHQLTEPTESRQVLPDDNVAVSTEEIDWVRQKLLSRTGNDEVANSHRIPNNFTVTVPAAEMGYQPRYLPGPLPMMGCPQTDQLLQVLDLPHILTIPFDPACLGVANQNGSGREVKVQDDNEIDIDDEDSDGGARDRDDNEIDIDDVEDSGREDKTTGAEVVEDKANEENGVASTLPKKPRLDDSS